MDNTLIENSRVLIVDDNFETLSFLGLICSEISLKVFSASTGKQAIAISKAKMPDLILLDVTMPDMNGFDVCKEIKENQDTKHIPILFITGKTDANDIKSGFNAGGVDYIIKPFNKEELVLRITNHLKIVRMQEQLLKDKEIMHLQELELLQKQKERFEHEVSQLQKEMQWIIVQMQKTNSIFFETIEKINNIIKSDKQNIIELLSPVIHNTISTIENNNWAEIETRFLKVHHQFYEKLLHQFPDLTKNELKLCAFLRLNLSTKEISAINLQSEEAIKKARYRLRQKLEVPSDQSLVCLVLGI